MILIGTIFMDRITKAARLMIVSDLDHTMVDHHDPENMSLLRFNALWESNYRHDSLLVFSTGRSPTLYKQLRKEKPMLTPDITIMSVGTEITYGSSMLPDDGWVKILNQKWDRNIVIEETSKFPELTLQAETEQRPHKVSFYVDKTKAQVVMKELSSRLEKRGLDVKLIYSGGMDLDVLPQGAGKGQALSYLLNKLKTEGTLPVNTLACGDSGNDAELFSIPDVYGVMVSNAQEELLQWHAENAKGYEVVKFYLFYERWRRGEAANCETYIASLKASCDPTATFVFPTGVEKTLHECIYAMKGCYGDQKGKQFRVWVDRVLSTPTGSNTWLVKFDKWELSGDERCCCVTTAKINAKGSGGASDGYTWVSVQQKWLEGYEKKDTSIWLF
ncbi:sucrose-phosphatase 2 isoform X3 [Gossypium hirsutum]|uniref:Sucrose-phosphatase n=2 Tax=Gossypium hirsutum TaxID=3635 RepID=A0ABM2ZZH3_GOSHI|nr:sucrose-phosphatase 2 isoform X3 [Gossypium hirsutum]